MKKSKLLLSFAIALCSVGVLSSGGMEVKKVEAAVEAYKTLTFPPDNKEATKTSTYSDTKTYTIGDFNWSITNFNNNSYNNNWTYIKCGSKKKDSIGTISTTNSIDKAIDNVVVTIDAVTASNVNSTSLIVSDKQDFSNEVEVVEVDIGKGDLSYKIANPKENMYYKLVYDCKKGSSNGLVTISKVSYYAVSTDPTAIISNVGDVTYTKVNGDNIQFNSELKNVESAPTPVYTSSDDTIASFDGSNLVPHKMGKVTATVTYTVGGTDYTASSQEIVIYPDNTNPLTVAEALEICEFTGTTETPYTYTVRGIVDSSSYSSSKIIAKIKDFGGEELFTIYNAAANSASDIVKGEYYSFTGKLFKYKNSTPEMQNLAIGDYEKLTLPLKYVYQNTTVSSQLSFAFEKDANGTFGGFTNMSLNFKTAFDFTEYTKGTDFTEAGMMFIKGSDVSETYSKTTAVALPENAKKATQTDYSKEFIVRLEDIPVSDWEKDVTVVPYILIDGTYYFGTASATNVIEVAGAYSSSEATIKLSDESVVKVKDVAAAIEDFYIASI